MKLLMVVMLTVSLIAEAQTSQKHPSVMGVSCGLSTGTPGTCVEITSPAPLKCGKYEEFETAHSVGTSNLMAMTVPDRCVPILHTVTEKEWQELMSRLKRLEAR